MLSITVVNRCPNLPEAELRRAVRAIDRQLSEHFEPAWKFGARLHLHDEPADAIHGGHVSLAALPGRHGDAVIYVADEATVAGAEGYHDANASHVPFGFVFVDVCRQQGDSWTVALSHEVIELVADPMSNLLVEGRSPHDPSRTVFHVFELCDPVTDETYEIDGVEVSNFVFPGYFLHGLRRHGKLPSRQERNDFMGRSAAGEILKPFSTAPGGYLQYFDPNGVGDKWKAYTAPGDVVGARRLAAKLALRHARIARRQKG